MTDEKNLVTRAKNIFSNISLFWNKPPHGNYMTFKEIVSLSIGGIGVKFIITCTLAMILSTSNFLIGNVIGIDQKTIYILYVISVISSFPLTALRASIIDNTRSKKGKYRPYLVSMGIPTLVISLIFIWAPYEVMNHFQKCVVVLICNIGFQFFYNFYSDIYTNYVVVLSPNTQERASVSSIKAVTDSFAPSIINIIIPLGAKLITGQDTLDKLIVYRYLYTPLLLLGFVISLIAYVNTSEKIVQAKTHIIQVKFMNALRAVAKNKYFWIISLAGWIGFLESSYAVILQWLYNYQHVCSAGVYTIVTTIYSNASFWGMLFAPALIKRYGKKNLLVATNLLNVLFIAAMYPVIRYVDPKFMIWFLLICLFANGAVCAVAHIITPCINADIRDYQQYITGERIDGMYSAVGLIGTVIMLLTSGVLPFLYEKGGINTQKALELGINLNDPNQNVYHVLYNTDVFYTVIGILIASSVIGAFLNVIPYFFYDLSEAKQQGYVKVLKVRAGFEDYGNNVLTDKDLVEVIDIIKEAQEYAQKELVKLNKKPVGNETKKEARERFLHDIETNNLIISSRIVVDELNLYNTDFGKFQLDIANQIYSVGLDSLVLTSDDVVIRAKSMPSDTLDNKKFRKYAIEKAKQLKISKKIILRNYPDGLEEFDSSILSDLTVRENELIEKTEKAIRALKSASNSKDNALADKYKKELDVLKIKRKSLDKEIKKAIDENSVYHRAARPFLDSRNILVRAENYKKFDEIASKYDEAKIANELAEKLKKEEERLEREKKTYEDKLLSEKKSRKIKK